MAASKQRTAAKRNIKNAPRRTLTSGGIEITAGRSINLCHNPEQLMTDRLTA